MKIHIYFYSKYKFFFFFNFKINNILKIYIIIKKKIIKYFKIKNNLFYKNFKNNLILLIHNCNILNIIHSIKHFIKINHNSILENNFNDIF
ncbi:MAG: hypothetical protein NVS84_00665 [Candidatus Carsonella ruddii]|nr:MAG: hypothetical protein NVS84_00665 [Candidatus Carsonella ruddii]WMC19383.1 MAG: hypothetical protein NVS85_00665 [Candidatus Carsonella ruddii]